MKSPQFKQKERAWSKTNRLPEGWSLESFSNVVEINRNTLSANTPGDYSFFYLSLSDVNSGVINHPAGKICFKSAPERARRIVKQGDILLSTVRPNLKGFGYVDFSGDDYVCSTGFAVLSPKTNVVGQYLYQFLYSHQVSQYFYSCVVGSNYPAINNIDIERISLPLPPIDEQKKISQILSTWDRAIERVQRLIEAKQRQKKGLMQGLLTGRLRFPEFGEPASDKVVPEGWEYFRLSQIVDIINGGTPSRNVPEYWNGNIPWIAVGDFSEVDRYIFYTKEKITELGLRESSTNLLHTGELIISARGTVGAIAQLTKSMAFNQTSYGLRANPALVLNDFLFYLLRQFNYKITEISHGAIFDTITRDTFEYIELLLPSIQEQRKIADVLGKIDIQIEMIKKLLEKLKQAKKGLMQKLLTGEIRVKVD